jgi:hypothetical protein
MPLQNALPDPVIIIARAGVDSISVSAASNSSIICVEIALRFSGRVSVIVTTGAS